MKLLITAVLLAATSTAASAASYIAPLSGAQQVPANLSTATGMGSITFDGMDMLGIEVRFDRLAAPLAAGHIHCCAPVGANAGVALDFAVPALTSGMFSASVDLSLDSSYTAGFLAASGGTAALARARLLGAFDSGDAYFNLHNSVFPGGEIRGQIAAVPEPASWALMIGGFGLVGAAARRRVAGRAVAA